MPMTGSKDNKNEYYKAWAEMVVTIWKERVIKYNVRDTGDLLKSFEGHAIPNAEGDIVKIIHLYLFYGRMVDMGVGTGIKAGEPGRKKKPIYNKSYYYMVKRLTEKTAELYGEEFQAIIFDTLNF